MRAQTGSRKVSFGYLNEALLVTALVRVMLAR